MGFLCSDFSAVSFATVLSELVVGFVSDLAELIAGSLGLARLFSCATTLEKLTATGANIAATYKNLIFHSPVYIF